MHFQQWLYQPLSTTTTINQLNRAKHWLVVLGNLDYHTWSKETMAAPFLSQLE
jgi:hypothetical protein